MEANDDEPTDVKRAASVEKEIKKGAKDDTFEGYPRIEKKKQKWRHCEDKWAQKKTRKKDTGECCETKRRKADRIAKRTIVVKVEKPCIIPKPRIIPRHCLTKQDYINVLSTPSKRCPTEGVFVDVIRRAKPASTRLKQLAKPHRHKLLLALREGASRLPPALVDNLIKNLEGEACLTPEQAEKTFKDKKQRKEVKKVTKSHRVKPPRAPKKIVSGSATLFDKDAVTCQYLMAETFVKSILEWKCPIPKEEFRDISRVIMKRMRHVLDHTLLEEGDRKTQQMRFLSDVVACWIAGVLLEVAEAQKKEIEEYCEKKRKELEAEDETEEEDEDEDEDAAKRRRREEREERERKERERKEEEEREKDQSFKKAEEKEPTMDVDEIAVDALDEEEERRRREQAEIEEEVAAEEEMAAKEEMAAEEEERKREEEAAAEEERRKREEEERKREEEAAAEEERRKGEEEAAAEEERRRQEELAAAEEEKRKGEEEAAAEEEKRRQEELAAAEEERRKQEEAAAEEERRRQEEEAAEEERKKREEEAAEEERRKREEEEMAAAEQARKKEEEAAEEERRRQEEESAEAERRKQEESAEAERRKQEEAAEEERRKQEEAAEEERRKREEEEAAAGAGAEAERKKQEEEAAAEEERRKQEEAAEEERKKREEEERLEQEEKERREIAERERLAAEAEAEAAKAEEERKRLEEEEKAKEAKEAKETPPPAEETAKPPPPAPITDLPPTTTKVISDLFKTDLPFVTISKIIQAVYDLVESSPENTGEDPITNRLHRAIYEKFINLISVETPEIVTDKLQDTIDVVCGKIATWLRNLLRESQIMMMEKYPAEVESVEIRDWSRWLAYVTDTAAQWSTWLRKVIAEADDMKRAELTRAQWKDWTSAVDTGALLWRRFRLQAVHRAHHNLTVLTDRKVVKTGTKTLLGLPDASEKVIRTTDL